MHQPTPGPNNSSSPPSPGSATVGEDVMKILEDVEGQLTRLRSAQKLRDDTVASLGDRVRAMQQAEDELDRIRQELSVQQRTLQEERTSLSNDREQLCKQQTELHQSHRNWEQQRQLLEGQLNKRHGEVEERAASLARQTSDFQAERDRVAAMTRLCQQQQEQLERQTRQMESERAEIQRRLDQAESNVGQLIRDVETSQQALAEQSEAFAAASRENASLRSRQSELEKTAEQATRRGEELERESVELAKLADQERNHVAQQLRQAQAQAAAVEEASQEMAARVEDLNSRLNESQEKLSLAGKKLAEFAQVLSEQTPQLEKGAAALAMVQQQQDQIERLTRQLAETKLRSDPEELQRRDQRINELTEALRQARGQSAGSQGVAEVELRNSELEQQIDTLRLQLQQAELAAQDARKQIREGVENQAAQTVQDSSIAEQAARIAALTSQVEELQAKAAAELKSQLQAQQQRHQAQLSEQERLESETASALRQRIAELESQVEQSKLTAGGEPGEEADAPADYADMLRDRAERVSAVAEHLRRRRKRLSRMRELVRGRLIAQSVPSASTEMRAELQHKLDAERLQIEETRRMLVLSERQMIRRWARPRALFSVSCMVLVTTACALASWFLADHLSPAQIAASVVLEARTRDHAPLTAERADAWRQWHTELINDHLFHSTLAKRMAERRMDQYSNPVSMGMRLKDNLTIDADQDGVMILTLSGYDPNETMIVLDLLATTAAVESERQLNARNDDMWAAVAGERREGGRIAYASLNSAPIHDSRLTVAIPAFLVLMTAIAGVWLATYTKLARARRVFDEQNAGLFMDTNLGES